MNKRRLRREDADRTEPLRNWQQLFRTSESWPDSGDGEPLEGGARSSAEHDGADSTRSHANNEGQRDPRKDSAVSDAVGLGYRVIEDQIRQGRRVAEQLTGRVRGGGLGGDGVGDLIQDVLRFYTDLGNICFELLGSVVRNTAPGAEKSRPSGQQSRAAAGNHAAADGRHTYNFEIVCAQPTKISLDVRACVNGTVLAAHALQALDADKPPLTDISFAPGDAEEGPSLRIRIPEGQPPDVYTGVVIDRDTNQPQGTLSVRIIEHAAVDP